MREKLAPEESKEGQAIIKTFNKVDIESESNGLTQLKSTKYKCDLCSFEAKSTRGLKSGAVYFTLGDIHPLEYPP